MDILAPTARMTRLDQTGVLAEIFRTAAEYVAATRAQDEVRAHAVADGVDTIRAALTRWTDEVPADSAAVPTPDDEKELLRQVAAIMDAP